MTDTTTNDTTYDATTELSGQRTYEAVLADAVRVLTEAARRTITWADRDGVEHRDQADFAEFVTHAVAGAAANLGSVEAVLAGRPGSWEAHHVRQRLHATVGYDEQYLLEHRTEPIVVRVHVDDILNDLGFWAMYNGAHEEIGRREDAIHARHDESGHHGEYASGEQTTLDELDALHEALTTQREREWAAYGEAFTANVHRAAAELFPALRVPVQVIVELDWQNQLATDDEFNGPEWRLWETARLATPLPGTGIPLKDYPMTAHTTVTEIERTAGRDPLTRLEHGEGQR
jgi:hypothetical protein